MLPCTCTHLRLELARELRRVALPLPLAPLRLRLQLIDLGPQGVRLLLGHLRRGRPRAVGPLALVANLGPHRLRLLSQRRLIAPEALHLTAQLLLVGVQRADLRAQLRIVRLVRLGRRPVRRDAAPHVLHLPRHLRRRLARTLEGRLAPLVPRSHLVEGGAQPRPLRLRSLQLGPRLARLGEEGKGQGAGVRAGTRARAWGFQAGVRARPWGPGWDAGESWG